MSLVAKIDLLRVWVILNKPNIITISETWLHGGISDNQVNIDDYVIYRQDRGSNRGGVATYVSKNLTAERVYPTVEPVNFESLSIKIILKNNKSIIINNIYRPPSEPADSMKNIMATITSFKNNSEIITLGDFNCNWLHRSSSKDKSLVRSANLTQLITEPTRVTQLSSTLIDWILVTNPDQIVSSGVLPDSFSDHSVVFCVWKVKVPKLPPKYVKVRQTKNINSDLFLNDLANINWTRFQLIPDVTDAWEFLYSEMLEVINKHAPFKTIRVKGRHLPWISTDLINLFKQRDHAWTKYRKSKNPADWELYRKLRNQSKIQTRNAKSSYYQEAFTQNYNNPKQFWKHLDQLLNRSKDNIIENITVDNTVTSDPHIISDAFNQYFSSISSAQHSDYSKTSRPLNNVSSDASFSFSQISLSDVQQAICELKNNCSAGPDGFDAKFLKLGASVLIYPLTDLFNLSLNTCSIPVIWKTARVTPIFKGGDHTDLSNYRPISILCTIAKVFEKIIFRQLQIYLNHFNILCVNQSGFRPGYSTTTALLKFTNDVFSSLDQSQYTGAIFLDLSKAFDLVDHYLLLDKLKSIGLSRKALLWFNAYLHNRRQFVSFKGTQSQNCIVEKGVPQGSTLGPLLFSIFINDLPQVCQNCLTHLYADDTVVYLSSANLTQLQCLLQEDFNSVQNWINSNLLKLNMTKSNYMLFGTRHSLQSANLSITFDNGSLMLRETAVKYLGVWLDPELNFKPHIDYIIKSTYSCLMPLYRSSGCFSQQVRKKIITQLIFPIIDYGDIVYQNTYEKYLKPLNVLFNTLCRFILKCPFRTHHCILYDQLNWLQPHERRQCHWLQFIFRSVHLNVPLYLKCFLVPSRTSYSLRSTQYLSFNVPSIQKEVGRRSFAHKAPNDWNQLPGTLRTITSYGLFRSALYVYLKTDCSCYH